MSPMVMVTLLALSLTLGLMHSLASHSSASMHLQAHSASAKSLGMLTTGWLGQILVRTQES